MRPKAEIVDLRFDLYGTQPLHIAIGDQQSLWVTCVTSSEVTWLQRDGSTKRIPVDGTPDQLALGGESMWFTMPRIDAVGRIDRAGDIQNYTLPTGSTPKGIVGTEDGAWVTLSGTGDLACLTTDGSVEIVRPIVTGDDDDGSSDNDNDGDVFDIVERADANPQYIAVDDRGSLWFTRLDSADIVRMDADRTTESWTSPGWVAPSGISLDSEAAWIADSDGGGIWRISRYEKLLQRVESWPTNVAHEIVSDRSGGCWFTEPDEDLLGHIDADTVLTEYDISSYGTRPRGLVLDRDGVVWVALHSGGIIGVQP